MPHWLRTAVAILAGFVVWFAVATVGNFVIRWLVAGYSDVEKAMQFTSGMLVARLILGAVASVAAGAACASIGRSTPLAIYLFAVLLLALFVPVHVGLWATFPAWYHIVFLGSLIPLAVLGARLVRVWSAGAKPGSSGSLR
ncbi:MAG TPA: hypothetical protein VMN79_11845 [Casimicrobiaceae bacterium]|nr:hypothetical protein [Casimicrobiaceae bacterium]